ncbi:MAG: Spo0E family sporulation regulatory protein-aspartic acid phosphatase [Clostridium sp.]|uniref:Spo0E family sporulation regulatory protein-aspartic acid phosphatase n=1 Tax=Clostridium sp. TaxID=1506 RepID=UPI003D6CED7B
MFEEKIDRLREKLHLLIDEKASYSEILNVSEELDIVIFEVTSKNLTEQVVMSLKTEP